MKAWLVRKKDEFCATVVFAETRGKAKSVATHTDACDYAEFCDIEVRRQPQLDKYYVDGKIEMDWDNPKDRIALVSEGGFCCDVYDLDREECEVCPASKYCDNYQDYLTEMEDESDG